MSAMTSEPANASAGGSTSGSFGAPSVTVTRRVHGRTGHVGTVRGQSARQIDRHDGPRGRVQIGHDRLREPGQRRVEPRPEQRVHDDVRAEHVRAVQLPRGGIADLDDVHAEIAQHVEVRARVAFHVGRLADEIHADVEVPLDERARDDEAVAAVVAASAEHGDAHGREALERRLHRGDDLAAGVFHEHDRRHADLLDRAAIGFAHLFGREHAHAGEVLRGRSPSVYPCARLAQLRMNAVVFVNGTIADADRASIPVFDHGFLFGEGIYETLRTYGREPFLFDRHLRRLRHSASLLALDVPWSDADLLADVRKTMAAQPGLTGSSGAEEAYIRILVTRGVGELSYNPAACPQPSLVIIVKPFPGQPERTFSQGIKIALVSVRRNHPQALNPQIKSQQPASTTRSRCRKRFGAAPKRR